MSKVDILYHNLSDSILTNGYTYFTDNRSTIPCIQLSSVNIDIPLTEFPLLTTKKMFTKGIVEELLWFLRGDSSIKPLLDKGVHIWDKDAYGYLQRQVEDEHLSLEQFVFAVQRGNFTGDVGRNYGVNWRKWTNVGSDIGIDDDILTPFDQITNLITNLKKDNPISRRHIITAWNPAEIDQTALPCCHWAWEVIPRPLTYSQRIQYSGKDVEYLETVWKEAFKDSSQTAEEALILLNEELKEVPMYGFILKWHQRSCDTFLGIPFNIASYGLLAYILGSIVDMIPLSIIGDLSNVHFYTRPEGASEDVISHVDLIKQQLANNPNTYEGCQLSFSDNYQKMLTLYKEGTISFDEFQIGRASCRERVWR